MSKNSSKALNWIAGGIAAYFVGSAIAGAIKRKNATSGIGDIPVWNRGHIKNWFAYEHYGYPEKIMVDLNPRWYVNDGCVEVESHGAAWAGRVVRNFSIRKKDLVFLREMCERYNVKYIEL